MVSWFCVLLVCTDNNAVYVWGRGREGQLGLGNTRSYRTPQRQPWLCDIVPTQVGAGCFHSLLVGTTTNMALLDRFEPPPKPVTVVWAWGDDRHGQLGLGRHVPRFTGKHARATLDEKGVREAEEAEARLEQSKKHAFTMSDRGSRAGSSQAQPASILGPVSAPLFGRAAKASIDVGGGSGSRDHKDVSLPPIGARGWGDPKAVASHQAAAAGSDRSVAPLQRPQSQAALRKAALEQVRARISHDAMPPGTTCLLPLYYPIERHREYACHGVCGVWQARLDKEVADKAAISDHRSCTDSSGQRATVPQLLKRFTGVDIEQITVGGYHTLLVARKCVVYCCCYPWSPREPPPLLVADIAPLWWMFLQVVKLSETTCPPWCTHGGQGSAASVVWATLWAERCPPKYWYEYPLAGVHHTLELHITPHHPHLL